MELGNSSNVKWFAGIGEYVIERAKTFAKALLDEAATLFLSGEPETARLILRDLRCPKEASQSGHQGSYGRFAESGVAVVAIVEIELARLRTEVGGEIRDSSSRVETSELFAIYRDLSRSIAIYRREATASVG